MHERSAMHWDEMAQKVEEYDRLARENAAAKAKRDQFVFQQPANLPDTS